MTSEQLQERLGRTQTRHDRQCPRTGAHGLGAEFAAICPLQAQVRLRHERWPARISTDLQQHPKLRKRTLEKDEGKAKRPDPLFGSEAGTLRLKGCHSQSIPALTQDKPWNEPTTVTAAVASSLTPLLRATWARSSFSSHRAVGLSRKQARKSCKA